LLACIEKIEYFHFIFAEVGEVLL